MMSRSSTNDNSPPVPSRRRGQCPPPRPALTIISLNVEGLTATKEELIAKISAYRKPTADLKIVVPEWKV